MIRDGHALTHRHTHRTSKNSKGTPCCVFTALALFAHRQFLEKLLEELFSLAHSSVSSSTLFRRLCLNSEYRVFELKIRSVCVYVSTKICVRSSNVCLLPTPVCVSEAGVTRQHHQHLRHHGTLFAFNSNAWSQVATRKHCVCGVHHRLDPMDGRNS